MTEIPSWYSGFWLQLSPGVRGLILGQARLYSFQAGETIFREGDPSRRLYIVKSGRVAIEVHVPSKGRRTIAVVDPGEPFSWSVLVEPCVETASARALEETEVVGIDREVLLELCREDVELGFEVYRALSEVITGRLNATRLELSELFATT